MRFDFYIMQIEDLFKKYSKKIDRLDLELIIAHTIKKTREFVLAHPEYKLMQKNELRIENYANRRIKSEPLAYILGHKEFYGLDFKVNKHTLIPRPETELLVELVLKNNLTMKQFNKETIIDVGTGSGNIIISLAKSLEERSKKKEIRFFGTDISSEALKIAKYNAKKNKLNKKIKFIKSDLLNSKKLQKKITMKQCGNVTIIANLPYLSKKIYNSTKPDIKNYEPKSALYSPQGGLRHYEKLLRQIKTLHTSYFFVHASCFMEFSPEQKNALRILIKKILPSAQTEFKKDLAGKWRVCAIKLP